MGAAQRLLGEKDPENFSELVAYVFRHYRDHITFPKIIRTRNGARRIIQKHFDPVQLVYETTQLVWDYNFRQQEDATAELPLSWLWRFRQRLNAIGVLQLDPRENSLEEFKRRWGELSLDRDLARETLDAACLIRTIYSRHANAKDLDPFWFTFDAHSGKFLLYRIFTAQLRGFTKNYRDCAQRAALRGAPPHSLGKTADILAEQSHYMDPKKSRLVYSLVLRELRRRLLVSGESQSTLGKKPKQDKNTDAPNAAERAYIQKLNALFAQKPLVDPVWRIGNADYLAVNPGSSKRERAVQIIQDPCTQQVLQFATVSIRSENGPVRDFVRTKHQPARKGRDPENGRFVKTTTLTQAALRRALERGRVRT